MNVWTLYKVYTLYIIPQLNWEVNPGWVKYSHKEQLLALFIVFAWVLLSCFD